MSFQQQPNSVTLPSIKTNNSDSVNQRTFASDIVRLDSRSVSNNNVQLPSINEFESSVPSHATIFRAPKKIKTPTSETCLKKCHSCQSSETPEWRKGPFGPRTLCNACGLIWSKLYKQEQDKNHEKNKYQNTTRPTTSSSSSNDKLTLSFLLS